MHNFGGCYISLPYATFCLEYDTSTRIIARVPPIARWALGRTVEEVVTYYRRKGAVVAWC